MDKQIQLICNNCGHSIQASFRDEYIACQTCSTPLKIEYNQDNINIKIVDRQEFMSSAILPVQAQQPLKIEALEEQLKVLKATWEKEQEQFLIKDNFSAKKQKKLPQKIRSLVIMIIGYSVAIATFIKRESISFSLLPVLGILYGSQAAYELYMYRKYAKAKAFYDEQIKALEEAIQQLSTQEIT